MKIGSLCTGYGGLDIAVEAYFNAETVWTCEFDQHASQVVKERIKKPNFGDLTQVNWHEVEPIDILTAGYPCQPFSHAGQRKGTNDKRHIFPYIAQAIEVLRPRIIVLENVRGHLSLGFEEVLGTLTQLGYNVKWQIVRASDVGAPHQRARLFIVASANTDGKRWSLGQDQVGTQGHQGQPQSEPSQLGEIASNTNDIRPNTVQPSGYSQAQSGYEGDKLSIINAIYGQEVPHPVDQEGKLNVAYVEYMMGLPKGWITDLELSRKQQLKILGNGVVPQQALYAIQQLSDTPSDLHFY